MSVRSSTATTKSIVCCFRSSRTGSSVATRRFTSSIRINVATICNGWLRWGSTRRPPSRAGNSSFGPTPKRTFGTAVSIRIGCWRCSSSWPAATPREGFPLSRIVCHMDWAAEDRSHVDNLVEFESRVNDVWRRHDDAVICVYDLAKFGGDTVVDIMRTHPMIIIGGILQQNPFFVPPEEFLRELRERRAGQTASPSTAALTWKCNPNIPPRRSSAFSAASMIWSASSLFLPSGAGGDPSQIVRTLLDVLLRMLRLDLVYVRLKDPAGEAPVEMVRVAQSRNTDGPAARDRRDAQPLVGT